MFHLLAIGMPGPGEWVIIAFIGLLFFGKRLPEVGRSLGKGIIEFKKGLKGIEEEINTPSDRGTAVVTSQPVAPVQPVVQQTPPPQIAQGFRFDPYTGKQLAGDGAAPAVQQNPPFQETSTTAGVSSEKTGV